MPDSQDTAIYEAIPLSDYINCTTMAKETLVCRSPTISDSLSHQTSIFTKAGKSTKNKNLSSKSTGIQFNCLASINRSFQKKKAFLNKLDHYSQHHGENGLKGITVVN
jgi:hypothetical protein